MAAPAQNPAQPIAPLREVWSIAWPTVVTMTSYTLMQFVDKLMVAQVGPLHLTAQSNGGIWAFSIMSFAMGVLTVINTFVSQNLGAGRPQNGPRYAWAGLWLSLATWVVVLLPWAASMSLVFALMPNHSPQLQRLETGYAQILLCGSVVLLASRAIGHYFFGMHRPKVMTAAALIGNVVNVAGNYALIYGSAGLTIVVGEKVVHLPGMPGAPALGVYGAAIATVFGTLVELAILAGIFLGPRLHRQFNTRGAWRPDGRAIRDLLKIGWPAAVQWGNEIVCWSIFMTWLVGRFGEQHMAAGWIALAYMHLSFMPAVGFSVAVTSLVGRYIGAGQPDIAAARARLGLRLAVGYMTACALAFLLFRHELVSMFLVGRDISPAAAAEIVRIGGTLMICAAVFQTADAFGIVYSGALRGAGDTVWPGVITIVYSWLFIVAGGALLAWLAPGLESLGPWIASAVYIILFGMTMWQRFARGRWRSIQLLGPAGGAPEPGVIAPTPPATIPDAAVDDLADGLIEAASAGAPAPAARASTAR